MVCKAAVYASNDPFKDTEGKRVVSGGHVLVFMPAFGSYADAIGVWSHPSLPGFLEAAYANTFPPMT